MLIDRKNLEIKLDVIESALKLHEKPISIPAKKRLILSVTCNTIYYFQKTLKK